METITLMLEGGVEHEDFAGNRGRLDVGDLQFMTAGKGIMHAEMPAQDSERNVGIQLWVDLPEKMKMCDPRYRDLKANEIPQAKTDDGRVEVKVISGKSLGVESLRELAYTDVWLLDILIRPGGSIEQQIPQSWNAFAYVLQGVPTFSDGDSQQSITPYHNVVFDQAGDSVNISSEAGTDTDARIIFVAGQPLDQNIVQYGPFVQTSREGIIDAMTRFQTCTNGFERAADWESEIGKSLGRIR